MKKLLEEALKEYRINLEFLEKNILILEEISNLFISCLKNKGKIIFMGNGGSAADAQHLAAEFVGRFKKNRRSLSAIAITTDTSVITAIGNDFGFEYIFSKQIEALANKKDLVVGFSTSGNSKNVYNAFVNAKDIGVKTIAFLGNNGGIIKKIVDKFIIIPSNSTARIQEMHIFLGHLICESVENFFFNE